MTGRTIIDCTKEFTTDYKINLEAWSWVLIIQSHISLKIKWVMGLITDFLLILETWGSELVAKGYIYSLAYLGIGLVLEQKNPIYLLILLLPLILVFFVLVICLLLFFRLLKNLSKRIWVDIKNKPLITTISNLVLISIKIVSMAFLQAIYFYICPIPGYENLSIMDWFSSLTWILSSLRFIGYALGEWLYENVLLLVDKAYSFLTQVLLKVVNSFDLSGLNKKIGPSHILDETHLFRVWLDWFRNKYGYIFPDYFNRDLHTLNSEGYYKEKSSPMDVVSTTSFMEASGSNNEGNRSNVKPKKETKHTWPRPLSPLDPFLAEHQDYSKFRVRLMEGTARNPYPRSLLYEVRMPGFVNEWNHDANGKSTLEVNSGVEASRADQLRRELASNFLAALKHDFFVRGNCPKPNSLQAPIFQDSHYHDWLKTFSSRHLNTGNKCFNSENLRSYLDKYSKQGGYPFANIPHVHYMEASGSTGNTGGSGYGGTG